MIAKKIFFTKPKTAEIVKYELDETLGEHEVLVQTLNSIVILGTEGANFANLDIEKIDVDSSMRNPDYGNVGKVLAVGEKVNDYKVGDLVFSTKNHYSHFKIDERYDPPDTRFS